MNNIHLTEEQIAVAAEVINGNQYDSLPVEIKVHLSECDMCASEVIAVSELIKDSKDVINTNNEKNRILRIVITAAAAVAILVSAFYLLKKSNTNTNEPIAKIPEDTIITKPDEIKKENIQKEEKNIYSLEKHVNEETTLLAYQTNNDLEKIYNRFRDGNLRTSDYNIITDSILKTSSKEELILQWEGISNEVIIEIFNNKGEKIIDTTFTGNKFNITSIKNPALYYWKLIDSEFEMLFCGKIIFDK